MIIINNKYLFNIYFLINQSINYVFYIEIYLLNIYSFKYLSSN
jgi:hypothetical protein